MLNPIKNSVASGQALRAYNELKMTKSGDSLVSSCAEEGNILRENMSSDLAKLNDSKLMHIQYPIIDRLMPTPTPVLEKRTDGQSTKPFLPLGFKLLDQNESSNNSNNSNNESTKDNEEEREDEENETKEREHHPAPPPFPPSSMSLPILQPLSKSLRIRLLPLFFVFY